MSQGKLYIRAVGNTGAMNTLIVPDADPQDWFFMAFPNRVVMEHYAKEYDLTIEEMPNADNGEEHQ